MGYVDVARRQKYQREWQLRRRAERKKQVIALLGGQCSKCGYKENFLALEIDHIKPIRRKTVGSGSGGSVLKHRILLGKEDMANLRLLCANCHAIETYRQLYETGV
jgi:5-methylcytosine-specific restriction endonuclease McrA